MYMHVTGIFKLLAGLFLGVNALTQILRNETWWFIQNINLVFHEAGHLIFSVLGDFMSLIGGGLLEILIPVIVTFHFVLQRHWFSAAFGSWCLSTAFLCDSIYASDAQERLLPLLGGEAVLHDWYHILSRVGLLEYDDLIGYIFRLAGLACVALLIFLLSKDKDVKNVFKAHLDTK